MIRTSLVALALFLAVLGVVMVFARGTAGQLPRPAEDDLWERVSMVSAEGKVEPAPEFPAGVRWVQGEPTTLKHLKGRVVVLHFWTFGCINCQRNYPVYKTWLKQYADKDLTIVGVHTPEFQHEADADRVKQKAKENGLTFPVVLDNDSKIWKAWRNRYWPCIYLIDRQGQVRYRWEGELHLDKENDRKFAALIDTLLAEQVP